MLLTLSAFPAHAAAMKVFVSIAPQKHFVERIGGEFVEVSVLVPAGASPHHFEPKPRQMAALSKAALYFAVGIDFEKAWLPRIAAAHPRMIVVRTDEGIPMIPLADHRHEAKSDPRNPGKAEARAGHDPGVSSPDPHVWLSPPLVKIQAGHIRDALAAADPPRRTRYEANCAAFLREIDSLDAELRTLFAGRKGERFLVFHPSWGYFAHTYGLVQVPVEIEGKDPKPAQLQRLIRYAREEGIRMIFVQPQFSAKSAEQFAREIGGQTVAADPLAEDWAENLRAVARKFAAAAR
jgi:zinc transport system substrate-binding protein